MLSRWATGAVLLAWCLLAIGDAAHAGYYSRFGLLSVVAGFAVLLALAASGAALAVPSRRQLLVPAAVCVVLAVVNPTGPYLYLAGRDRYLVDVLAVVAAGAAVLVGLVPARWRRPAWLAVVGLAAASGIVTIVVIGNPGIDVWEILQQSSTGLLHGDDLYRQHWMHSTGLQAIYPYLPGSTLLVAPFRWVFGDVRFGLMSAAFASAWLVRRIAPEAPPALAALLLVSPGWVLLVNRAWTEPLLVAALGLSILAMGSGQSRLAVLGLAVALASKQHIVLLLPMFVVWPDFGWRRSAKACAIAFIVVLPWLVAGPRDLWHDAVHANLALPVQADGLDLPGLLAHHGHVVGFGLAAAMLALAYLVVFWRLPRTPSGLALACALVMWSFDLANKQTHFNHYVLPLGLLVLAMAAAPAGLPSAGAATSDTATVGAASAERTHRPTSLLPRRRGGGDEAAPARLARYRLG